ncbi:hypothetical protein Tco_1463216 [Tanacetum coccineum]
MNSPPDYEWEQLLDIDDFDLSLTPVFRLCNSHVRETTTTTQTLDVDNLEEKPVRIIPCPRGKVVGDKDFKAGSWVSMVEFVNANRGS